MLPGQMMVIVDAGFMEPEDIQSIVETLQKRASGHATALVAALKRSDQCSRFLLHTEYQEYKMHGCTETHFLSVVFCASPSKPSHSLSCTSSSHTTLPQKISSAYLVCAWGACAAAPGQGVLGQPQSFFWVLLKSN